MGIMFDTSKTTTSALDMALDNGALFNVQTAPMKIGEFVPTINEGRYTGEPEKLIHYRETESGPVVLNVAHPSHPSSNYLQVIETAEALFPGTTSSMNVLEDGRKLIFTQELGEEKDLGNGDTVAPHLMWRASMDSSWATGAFGLAHRFFCTNQIPMAKAQMKVRRSTNHDAILMARSEILATLLGRFEAFVDEVSTLKRITVTRIQFEKMLDRLVPAPAEDAHGKTVNTYEKKVAAIRYYFGEEANGPAGGSAWAVYNAFQSAELHDFTEGKFQERKQAEIVADGRHQALSTAVRRELLAV